jgi:hypothetical protein
VCWQQAWDLSCRGLHARPMDRSTAAPAWHVLRCHSVTTAPMCCCTKALGMCGCVISAVLACLLAHADPPGLCLNDTICAKDGGQCDTMNKTQVLRCSGGLDTSTTYGRCVPKPPPPPTLTQCERCSRCLTAAGAFVSSTFNSSTATSTKLGSDFYTWCSGRGYPLASCVSLQAAIAGSYMGNLARRAGALCQRLQDCPAAVAADSSCGLSMAAAASSGNATRPVTGRLDLCSVEGVTGGQQVAGLSKCCCSNLPAHHTQHSACVHDCRHVPYSCTPPQPCCNRCLYRTKVNNKTERRM